MVAKQLEYLANALMAGVVLGTRVPIVLTSRADTAETRTASCAIAQPDGPQTSPGGPPVHEAVLDPQRGLVSLKFALFPIDPSKLADAAPVRARSKASAPNP